MKKNIYRLLCLFIYIYVLEGCIPGEPTYFERDRHLGFRNSHLPATYQLGLRRQPIPGSPELFGLPQTTEPGPFYQPQMNHYFFSATRSCLPFTTRIEGLCANINFIRINENFFGPNGREMLL